MSRTKNASRNIIWGFLNKIITIGMPFVVRTALIYTLGVQYVGLGSLFTSVLQVLSFAELGIGSALVFRMYKPIAENDEKTVCALLNFYKKTYRIIGLIILVIGLMIMPFIKLLIADEIPHEINIYFLFGIYLVNNLIGYFLFAYKQSLLTASQRVDLISKIGMGLQFIMGLTQILALVIFRSYYLFVLIIPIITVMNNVCVGFITDKIFPQYKCGGQVEEQDLKKIKKLVSGMMFQKVGGIVLTSVDTLVISAFLGLKVLGVYQNYYLIITSLFGFLSVILQSLIASVGNSVATEAAEKNYRDFKLFNFIYVWIVSFCSICLLCLYQPFMKLWVGEDNMLLNYMVLLYAIYFFTHKWCDMLYVYQEACGIWWENRFVPLTAAVVNLGLNILLVQIVGLPGILVSTIVAVVFIYDVGYAKVLFSTYFSSVNKAQMSYWKRQVGYLVTTVVAAVITYTICVNLPVDKSILKLISNAVVCIFVPNSFFFLVYAKTTEYKDAIRLLGRIRKKV